MKRYFRIVACLLTLCVILGSLSSCMTLVRIGNFVQQWERGEFPVYDDSWQEYTLNEEDWKSFEAALEECRELIRDEASFTVIDRRIMEMEEIYYHIMTQAQVAYILYSADMKNKTASENYLAASKMQTDAYDAYMDFCQDLYDSDDAYKDHYFGNWTEDDLSIMQDYSDRVADLTEANDQIVVSYRDLQGLREEVFSVKVGQLFIKMVSNNNAIAKEYGYDSYPEYAYEKVYFRDYGVYQAETMRNYVQQHLIPLCSTVYERFSNGYDRLERSKQNEVSEILYDDCQGADAKWIKLYFKSLPIYMQRIMNDTLESKHVIYTDNENALPGAFTGYLYEYNYPVCYFGPGYQSTFTVAHEAGHYFASYAQKGMSLNMDLAEVYSQSNEFLFLAFLEDTDMDEDVYRVLADYQLYQILSVIIVATIVDEFERTVYTEAASFASIPSSEQAAALDECMEEICKDYGGMRFIKEYLTDDILGYWKRVVIENPMYYISYAMSGIASLDLYCKAVEDYDAAVDTYLDLVRNVDPEGAFLDNLTYAGLATPFEEETYLKLVETFE